MSFDKDTIQFVEKPSHANFIDITGQRFTRLTVIGYAGRSTSKRQIWFCECDCGTVTIVQQGNLRNGHTVSCGCLRNEKIGSVRRTHGMSNKHPLYNTWLNIRRRCHDPKCPKYPSYGGRGIKVCDRWRDSFANFVEDMGEKPSRRHSVERVDNEGDYTPENCIWALPRVQSNNQRSNHLLTYQGRTQTLAQWARELDLPYSCVIARTQRGWSDERTLTTPKLV